VKVGLKSGQSGETARNNCEHFCEASKLCVLSFVPEENQNQERTVSSVLEWFYVKTLKPKDYYLLSEFCLSFNGKKGHIACIIIVLIHLVKELFKICKKKI